MDELEKVMNKYKRDLGVIRSVMKKKTARALFGVGVSLNNKFLHLCTDVGTVRVSMALFTKGFRSKIIEGVFKNPGGKGPASE